MKLSKLFLSVFAFFVLVVCFTLSGTIDTSAKPKGDTRDSDVGKKLGGFEVLAVKKKDWSKHDTVCDNNGNRVFFHYATSGTIGHIEWELRDINQTMDIVDCDGTDNQKEVVVQLNRDECMWVVVKLVGPITDELFLDCQDDEILITEDLCVVDDITLTRNDDFTKIMANMFQDGNEDVTWWLECTGNGTCAKHMKVQLYEKACS